MGLEPAFLSMLNIPIGIERRTGEDQWGNETYSASETLPNCFVDAALVAWGRQAGAMVDQREVGTATVYSDFYDVKIGDRVTYDTQTWTVISVTNYTDEQGADYFQQFDIENQKKG